MNSTDGDHASAADSPTPVIAPPTPALPIPVAPPAVTPYSAAPYSAAPYSAAPYPTGQYSAPPFPYGPMPGPTLEKKHGRAGIIVLSILTALLLGASGVMTTLFLLKNRDADELGAQLNERHTTVTLQTSKISTLETDLDVARRALSDSRDEVTRLGEHNKAIAGCINSIYDMWDAMDRAGERSNAAVKAAAAAEKACDAADQFL